MSKNEDEYNCSICLEEIGNKNIYKTVCNHVYHKECIRNYSDYINRDDEIRCPLCNNKIKIRMGRLRMIRVLTNVVTWLVRIIILCIIIGLIIYFT